MGRRGVMPEGNGYRQWNSTLRRKAPQRRNGYAREPQKRRAQLPRIGKRGKAWAAVWRELKPRLERAGITSCEFRYGGCFGAAFLTPAHSMKRRNITTPEQLWEVALACVGCHAAIEILPEAEMGARVRAAIRARETAI